MFVGVVVGVEERGRAEDQPSGQLDAGSQCTGVAPKEFVS